MSTLAALAVRTLVGKVISEPIPEGCTDLIKLEKHKKEWPALRATVYCIPVCYAPLSDDEIEDAQGWQDAWIDDATIQSLEFNQSVPQGYDFTTEVPGYDVLSLEYEDYENVFKRTLDLLVSNGVVLKRGDIIHHQIYRTERE